MQKKSKKKLSFQSLFPMKKTGIILLFLLCIGAILAVTVFGNRGLLHLTRLKTELRQLEENNLQLQAENRLLKQEIELLKTSPHFLEELAREDLGLVKENELIYQFKREKNNK